MKGRSSVSRLAIASFVIVTLAALMSLHMETSILRHYDYRNEMKKVSTTAEFANENEIESLEAFSKLSPACFVFRYNQTKMSRDDNPNSENEQSLSFDFYRDVWARQYPNQPNGRPTRIKLLHMRKAGGTSIFSYFRKVVQDSTAAAAEANETAVSFREFQSCEGLKDCLELNSNDGFYRYYPDENHDAQDTQQTKTANHNKDDNLSIHTDTKHSSTSCGKSPNCIPERWDDSGNTLYVTHLREPIARALSNYKYSMRFDGCGKNKRAFPKKGTTELPQEIVSLQDFLTKKMLNFKDANILPKRTKLWDCNSNCYARWVTGMYNPVDSNLGPPDKTTATKNATAAKALDDRFPAISDYYSNDPHYAQVLMEEATKLLRRHHLIIVIDWLKDPNYVRLIEDVYFGGIRGLGSRSHVPNCDMKMKEFDRIMPLEVSKEHAAALQQNNAIDSELYTSLTNCRMDE